MFTKQHILDEIRRTANENNGTPLGTARFEQETGIAKRDWIGKIWVRWSEALIEAGFKPNKLQGKREDALERLAEFTKELGIIPVNNAIKLRSKQDQTFPSHGAFERFGTKRQLVESLRVYCTKHSMDAVEQICDDYLTSESETIESSPSEGEEIGFVYLLKSGKFYKIGKTNSVGRRGRELAIQLPEKAAITHEITTDDPHGIEAYWHRRFDDRRKNGEWFELTAADIRAFKRRKFM